MCHHDYLILIPKAFDVKCHEPLCNEHAHLFRYPELEDEESTTAVFYCRKHAVEHGFCEVCGTFCGGLESFEFGNQRGFCDQCWESIEAIDDDYDDEDEF